MLKPPKSIAHSILAKAHRLHFPMTPQEAALRAFKLQRLSWVDSVSATAGNTMVVTTKPLYVGKLCFGTRVFKLCLDFPRIFCPEFRGHLVYEMNHDSGRFCLGGFEELYHNFMRSFDYANAAGVLRCLCLHFSSDTAASICVEELLKYFNGFHWFKLISPDLEWLNSNEPYIRTFIQSLFGNNIEIMKVTRGNDFSRTREVSSYTLLVPEKALSNPQITV